MPNIQIECDCLAWDQCKWSKNMLNEISKLKHNDPSRRGMASFFRARICESKTRNVYCCDDESFPSESDLKLLKLEARIEEEVPIIISEKRGVIVTVDNTSVDVKVSTSTALMSLVAHQFGRVEF